ncbi:MAG: RNA pseudouridine synthase, partial [Verrucomicrobia bacterium]|nr:RNA pseudouridine synthase [Verrucomicrobiota bacterium]
TVSFRLGGAEAFMINRLDRETSGLVLVAKERRLAAQLHRAFWHKQVLKEYLAIVHGPLRGDHGEIDAPIALVRDHQLVTPHSSLVTPHVAIRRGVEPDGQPARTEWWVEGRAPKFTLLRLRLHTGRAHQIRVHLAHIGHPIVGDKIYGGDERLYLQFIKTGITPALLEKLLLPRHGLHAERLVVPYVAASHRDAKSSSSASRSDAATGAEDPIEWRAPLPEDLAEFWRQVSATPAT